MVFLILANCYQIRPAQIQHSCFGELSHLSEVNCACVKYAFSSGHLKGCSSVHIVLHVKGPPSTARLFDRLFLLWKFALLIVAI